jgi:hypothetical protein
MKGMKQKMMMVDLIVFLLMLFVLNASAWTGEIHGRVVCDVCGDSSLGPEDHVLEGIYLSLSLQLGFMNYDHFCEFYIIFVEFMQWVFCFLMEILLVVI